jgi:3-oxoacyl-[acyl-carrier protein] reductase
LHNRAAKKKKLLNKIPCRELPTPADIAACALFLCSDAARFITGQTLVADGGLSLTTSLTYTDNT